jgi:hypothetical protein
MSGHDHAAQFSIHQVSRVIPQYAYLKSSLQCTGTQTHWLCTRLECVQASQIMGIAGIHGFRKYSCIDEALPGQV